MGNFDQYVPGAYFTFGSYPQSAGSKYKTPIVWKVLDRKGDHIFAISKNILDVMHYEGDGWGDSNIRKWLNNDFLNTAFTKEEQKRIINHQTYIGVWDKVFILDSCDVKNFFPEDFDRRTVSTGYAKSKSTLDMWWIRDKDKRGDRVGVDYDGSFYSGYLCSSRGVRPVMWISLSSVATPAKTNMAVNVSKTNSVEDEEDLEVEEIDEEDLEVEEIDEEDLEVEEIDEEDLEVEEIDEEEPASNVRSTKGDNTFEELKKGDVVHFGSYYQENDKEKTPIEWIVLRKKEDDNTLTLISKNVLDVVPFDITKKSVKWGSSTVRQWLNNEFLNTAFTKEEQAKIVEKEAQTKDNSQYGTEGEKPGPFDKICLFAEAGIKKHFPSNIDRMAKPTPYAKSKGVACDSTEGSCHWWTRTPGYNQQYACVVDMLGNLNMFGEPAFADFVGIRPFIWIKL